MPAAGRPRCRPPLCQPRVGRGPRRVLISGAADYSILAYVLWACRENGLDAEVTVLDRCDTPLLLNTWYAEQGGPDSRHGVR